MALLIIPKFAPCGPDTTIYPSIPAPIVRTGMTANQVASDGTYPTYVHLQWDYLANNLEGFKIYRGATLLATIGKGMREYHDISNTTGIFSSSNHCLQNDWQFPCRIFAVCRQW